MRWFRRRSRSGLIAVGTAIECCGEHLFSEEQVKMHDEMYHTPEGTI